MNQTFNPKNPIDGLLRSITVSELYEKLCAGEAIELIDVREPSEFNLGHIPGSKLIPLYQIPIKHKEIDTSGDVVVICQNGIRSAIAIKCLEMVNPRGRFFVLSGGLHMWAMMIDGTVPLY